MSEELHIRPVERKDSKLLFEWVNSPDSLAGKLMTSGPIAWSSHAVWFEARLGSPDCTIWVAERGGAPAGQVRAERRPDGRLHVDIYVAPEARRSGIGAAMLERLADESARRWPDEPLVARVLSGNAASRRLFEGGGYTLVENGAEHAVFVRGAGS